MVQAEQTYKFNVKVCSALVKRIPLLIGRSQMTCTGCSGLVARALHLAKGDGTQSVFALASEGH